MLRFYLNLLCLAHIRKQKGSRLIAAPSKATDVCGLSLMTLVLKIAKNCFSQRFERERSSKLFVRRQQR